jgi:NAD(P)-dependent dehydrogenase (short-subunit alcohol dehydrogenase family)
MQELDMWVVLKVLSLSLSLSLSLYYDHRVKHRRVDATESDLDRVVKVNINGVFNCAKEAIRVMTADGKGGVILNTGSCASVHPIKDRVVYAATKGAVLTMTTSIATDHVHEGIRCNCICPGRVHTPFVDAFIKKNYAGNEKKMFKQLSEYMPQGRMLTPGEVAALALYLCSDEAKMITGSAITIDGGIQGVDHPKVYDKPVDVHPAFRSVL